MLRSKMLEVLMMNYEVKSGVYINAHYSKIILSQIRYCLQTSYRSSPSGLIAQGPTGIGKSRTIGAIQAKLNKEYIDKGKPPPIYIIGAPDLPTMKQYYSEILDALGDHSPLTGTEVQLRKRVFEQLKSKQVRMLIFDEFQQLAERRGVQAARAIMDAIKKLSDKFCISCVFVGTEAVSQLLKINEQVASRFGRIIKINYMSFNNKKAQLITRKFMGSYAVANGIDGMDLSDYEISLRLFAATNGDLRIFVDLLDNACGFLTGDALTDISIAKLKAAYSFMPTEMRILGRRNPFSTDLKVIEDILNVQEHPMVVEAKSA